MGGIDLELVAVGVLLVALIATSIVGNILVCIAVATDNNLRKLSNLFLVSLAIADLLVAGAINNFGVLLCGKVGRLRPDEVFQFLLGAIELRRTPAVSPFKLLLQLPMASKYSYNWLR